MSPQSRPLARLGFAFSHRGRAFLSVCIMLCCTASTAWAAEESAAPELAAQVWEYITTEDGDRARSLLASIVTRPDATVSALEDLLRKGRPHGLQPVGLLPDEQLVVRDRTYQYSLSVPQSYEPTRDYALILCLHGAGFTGEAIWTVGNRVWVKGISWPVRPILPVLGSRDGRRIWFWRRYRPSSSAIGSTPTGSS